MAAKIGDVVFKVGDVVDTEEFWDDSALIKAYEKAVNSFKFGLENESGERSEGKSDHAKKKKRRRKKQNKRQNKSSCEEGDSEMINWSVGDQCHAVYSEDGLVYDAEIIEICPDVENLCVVRYTHYGNEEQQYLTDLMPVIQDPSSPDSQGINIKRNNGSHSHQNGECSDTGSSNAGEMSSLKWKISDLCVAPEPPYQHYHEAVINSFSSSLTCKVTFIRSRRSHEVSVQDLQRSNDFHQNNSTRQPNANSSYTTSLPPFCTHGPHMGIPEPPVPPPPPPVSLDDLHGDDESLASMLMSWYLSGYHTGYFKAVQQFKSNHAFRQTAVPPCQPACPADTNPHSPRTNMDTKE